MARTLEDLFGVNTLSGLVQLFAQGTAKNNTFASLFERRPEYVVRGNDTVGWDEISFTRKNAGFVDRDGNPVPTDPISKTKRSTSLASIKLSRTIKASELLRERELGTLNSPVIARSVIGRNVKELTEMIQRSINTMCADALQGSIAFDATKYPYGEIVLPTVTYGVNTFTATASWGTAGTKILSGSAELPSIRTTMREACGEEPQRVIQAEAVQRYLLGNTEIQAWLQTTMPGLRVLSEGAIEAAGGIGGIPMWKTATDHYIDADGSVAYNLSGDKLIALAGEPMLVLAEGHGVIPNSAILAPRAEDLMPSFAPTPGFYSYAVADPRTGNIEVIVGWNGFPILLDPTRITSADVTP